MIRNNFLLVLLTFNFSPLLFSPIINSENVLSTGSLVGSKSWLSYKGSWFHLYQKEWTNITKSIQIKGSYSLCENRNINTCPYHQYYNISALCNTNKPFKKHLQSLPPLTTAKTLSSERITMSLCSHKSMKQNTLECFSQSESFRVQQPRERNWAHVLVSKKVWWQEKCEMVLFCLGYFGGIPISCQMVCIATALRHVWCIICHFGIFYSTFPRFKAFWSILVFWHWLPWFCMRTENNFNWKCNIQRVDV